MRLLRLFLFAAGVAIGVMAESVQFGWRDPGRWVPDLLVGWAFIACGLIVMPRHPGGRIASLMMATGFTWFLPNLAGISVVATNTLFWHRGPLVQLVLTYPEAHTTSWLTRTAVSVGYAAAVFYAIWQSEPATIAIAVLLIAASIHAHRALAGAARRAHRFSLTATASLGVVLIGEAIVRLSGPTQGATDAMLLAYEAVLCAIAIDLTIGLLVRPWERMDVTDLVVELGRMRTATLRDELSRALGDPSLEVGYWVTEQRRFLDADGHALDGEDIDPQRPRTLVERDGEPIAVIIHDPAVLTDPGLVRAVESATKLGAANARLRADVRARQAETRASRRRIVGAADEERGRLERRLHDTVQRRLDELGATLRKARRSAGERSGVVIDETEAHLERTQQDLDRFARGIHPHELATDGLAGALGSLAKDFPFLLDVTAPRGGMPTEIESCVYFVCLEALTNVAKYADASRASISVDRDGESVIAIIEDDGVGGADPAAGSGLRGLADRVEALGGTLQVGSADGRGTRVTAIIPTIGSPSGS